jgi:hypothetical protein
MKLRERVTAFGELKTEEADVVAYLRVLSRRSPGGTEEDYETAVRTVSFPTETPRIQVRNVTD